MHVAIDAGPAMRAQRTGVARYVENLVRGLAEAAPDDDTFGLAYRMSLWRRRRHRLRPPDDRFRAQWFQGRLGVGRADVAHGPDGRLLWARGAKRVVTVHDVFALEAEGEGTEDKRLLANYLEACLLKSREDYASLEEFVLAAAKHRAYENHPAEERKLFGRLGQGLAEAARLDTAAAYSSYLDKFPNGPNAIEAQRRYDNLTANDRGAATTAARTMHWLLQTRTNARTVAS